MPRVIADEKIPFLKGILEPYAGIEYLPASLITKDSIKRADAILIRTRTKCDASLLEGTSVKFIATATIGYDHIDTDYCKTKNIHWANAPGCNSFAVQQYWLAAILALAGKHNLPLREMTLGIVGVGNVGAKVETAARILGMRVKLNDPPRAVNEGLHGFVSIDEILETCDVITLHVPLNYDGENKTFHLFDDRILAKVKQGAWFINTSRGEVVETAALKRALSNGTLSEAALDVWENEPGIDLELLRKVSVATPHIAGYSLDGKSKATEMIVNSFMDYFSLAGHKISLPTLPYREINVDASAGSAQKIIHQALNLIYPISDDHSHLQNSPESFEQLRSNYLFRRDFPAYRVTIQNSSSELANAMEQLGFSINKKK